MSEKELGKNISLENYNICFETAKGKVRAVKDVNTVFEAGKVTGMIGESGSGKSVLGMGILKLLASNARVEGRCLYGDTEISAYTEKQMDSFRGKEIALIPQNPAEALDPVIRIKKQLTEAVTSHGGMAKAEGEKRYETLMRRFGFQDPGGTGKKYSFQMSGGMNQRIISVLGLMCAPKWILADEPTKGLDAILRRQVYGVLKDILGNDIKSMIVITHDVALARRLCDRILVLYQGEVLEQGDTSFVLDSPLHPYTEGLVGSLPSNGMVPIPLPDRDKETKSKEGCVFYPRCPRACSRCAHEKPGDYRTADGRKVRCFLYA